VIGPLVAVAAIGATLVTATSALAASARGVAGGKIVVAGLGAKASLGDAEIGAAARFARANSTKEVKGYTFDFKEFADDANDPATAVNEARRLVASEDVFAVVPDLSQVTPGTYLTQQHVPWFGPGFDGSYCGTGDQGWGFALSGCVVPAATPRRLPNRPAELLKRQLAGQGISKPTIALIAGDQESGRHTMQNFGSTYTGAGFDVVYAKGIVPAPPAVVGDFSPFAEALLSSDHGKQPDVIYSGLEPISSLKLFGLLKARGFEGNFISPFYSKLLLPSLEHGYVFLQYASFESDSPNMRKMRQDIQRYKPGVQYSLALGAGYLSADMFIAAVKKAGRHVTPAKVRRAAAHMTYELDQVVGPVRYPASFKLGTPSCATLLYDADGTAFTVAQPYSCSTKTYPILSKFAGG
jgi:branched-chain amino acid transport system substrate-binding protein